MKKPKTYRVQFSLIEIMIVLLILVILMSFLFPIVKNIKNKAYEVQCISNYRQIYNVMQIYTSDNSGYLPSQFSWDYYGVRGKNATNTHGWHGHLAPYLYNEPNNNWQNFPEKNSEFIHNIINFTYPNPSKKWSIDYQSPETGWGPFKIFVCPKSSTHDRVGHPFGYGLPFSYMGLTTFMRTNNNGSSAHRDYAGEASYYKYLAGRRTTAKLDSIEDAAGKVLLYEGMGIWPINQKKDTARETLCVPEIIFSADTSPISYGWWAGIPEDHSKSGGNINNHHGFMTFGHDDDEDILEGYQMALFADGHVEKAHEWWYYLNAPVISSIQGKGFTPSRGLISNGVALQTMKNSH